MTAAIKMASKLGLLIAATVLATACGSEKQSCRTIGLTVGPPTATADHTAIPPGNQVQFFAGAQAPPGCLSLQCVNCAPGLTWSVSDPVNVSISNNAIDNGTSTCLGATNGAVTVTATALIEVGSNQTVSGTALLTCR